MSVLLLNKSPGIAYIWNILIAYLFEIIAMFISLINEPIVSVKH